MKIPSLMFVIYELSCGNWFIYFSSMNCDGEAANSVGKWFLQGPTPAGLSWWTPLFMMWGQHSDLMGADLCSPILLTTLPSLWEKPNQNVSCLDGLAGEGQESVWYPKKLSGKEGVTPKTFSGMLNTPKLCWDPSVWILISPLLLCCL